MTVYRKKFFELATDLHRRTQTLFPAEIAGKKWLAGGWISFKVYPILFVIGSLSAIAEDKSE